MIAQGIFLDIHLHIFAIWIGAARKVTGRIIANIAILPIRVDEETQKALRSGKLLTEALKQPRFAPIPDHFQALLLFAVTEGYANNIKEDEMHKFESELYEYFDANETDVVAKLKTGNKMDNATRAELVAALDRFASRN